MNAQYVLIVLTESVNPCGDGRSRRSDWPKVAIYIAVSPHNYELPTWPCWLPLASTCIFPNFPLFFLLFVDDLD